VQGRERAADLHQASAFAKWADVDRGEPERVDQLVERRLRLDVVPGVEEDLC
jgi:hypothetical protein